MFIKLLRRAQELGAAATQIGNQVDSLAGSLYLAIMAF